LQQIVNYHREYTYPFIPNLDPDAALYQIGFFSHSDEKLFKAFQAAPLDEKEAIAKRLKSRDARILAVRLLGRNYLQQISPDLAGEFETYLRRVNPAREEDAMIDYREVPRMTPSAALTEIRQLKKSGRLDNHQKKLLDDLQKYIKTNFPKRKAGRQLSIGDNF
jgi:exodeoxyribonuclease-1